MSEARKTMERANWCDSGVLVGHAYGIALAPDGTVFVQRCDECGTYNGDDDAAAALAERWGGMVYGFACDPSGRGPGDYWVTRPNDD